MAPNYSINFGPGNFHTIVHSSGAKGEPEGAMVHPNILAKVPTEA